MPRIYKNHHAGFKTYMIPLLQGSSNGSKTYKCLSLILFKNKWIMKWQDYYASDFKPTDKDHFKSVGKINLKEILTKAILEHIYEEKSED